MSKDFSKYILLTTLIISVTILSTLDSLAAFINNPNKPQLILSQIVQPQTKYPRGIKVSSNYRIMIKTANDQSPWNAHADSTATYELSPDYLDPQTVPKDHREASVHFGQLDTNTRIRVRVELLKGSINTLRLLPKRHVEIDQTEKHGKNWVEFEVAPSDLTKHILVEINAPQSSDEALKNGLMIFVNPISQLPDGKVLKLPSGVIYQNHPAMDQLNRILIDKNSPYDALYIPADTIVNGRIEIKKDNFKVTGRGMIVGSRWTWVKSKSNWRETYPREISPDGKVLKGLINSTAQNVTYEGITSIHPYHFNFVGAKTNLNLKTFGWRMSSDGIHGEIIKGCFTRVNDDANYFDCGIIARNTYWGMQNGAIFQLGWGQAAINNGGGTRISECDVVRGEWRSDGGNNQNNGIFVAVMSSGKGNLTDIKFDDIKIYGNIFRPLAFHAGNLNGNLINFEFKNIWFEKKPYYPKKSSNYLECGGMIKDFKFINFYFGDQKLTSLDDLQPISTKNVSNLIFK